MKIAIIHALLISLFIFKLFGEELSGNSKLENVGSKRNDSGLSIWIQGKNGTIIIPISTENSTVIYELERKETPKEFTGYTRITEEGYEYRATVARPGIVGFVVSSSVDPNEKNIAAHVKFLISYEGIPLDVHYRDVYTASFKDSFKKLVPLKYVLHENSDK